MSCERSIARWVPELAKDSIVRNKQLLFKQWYKEQIRANEKGELYEKMWFWAKYGAASNAHMPFSFSNTLPLGDPKNNAVWGLILTWRLQDTIPNLFSWYNHPHMAHMQMQHSVQHTALYDMAQALSKLSVWLRRREISMSPPVSHYHPVSHWLIVYHVGMVANSPSHTRLKTFCLPN